LDGDEGCEVWFEGRIDIRLSNGPQMKMISPVCDEKEWTTYVDVMMKSSIREIELVARMVACNDVSNESSRSPTLPEAVDEHHVECGILLTQPSQETQDDTAEVPLFIASNEQRNMYEEALVLVMFFPIRASFQVWILSQLT
jgi:hypothetical protein